MLETIKKYCNSVTEYSKLKTREVKIGNTPLGGDNPIRVQSMTTTDTMDTEGTVEQSIRMIEKGCEYVRITAPSKKDAANMENIKNALRKRCFDTPLVADIHFTPNAAEIAARIVEKVRVNPGNYADKKKFLEFEISDDEYKSELERIREKFTPLVKICKEEGTAMRIGTNHGSLSDRIMNRYGDSPLGMVESALEFVRICEDNDFYDIVLSMKASNTQVMVQAYRLLVQKMNEEGMNYPIHLGVTEAGDGEDGRIKSAVGIGTLLEDGIGDTIRVSLTEEPEAEIPVVQALVERYNNRAGHKPIPPIESIPKDPVDYIRSETFEVAGIGKNNPPRVFADYSDVTLTEPEQLRDVGYIYSPESDKWNLGSAACDILYLGKNRPEFELPQSVKAIYDYDVWKTLDDRTSGFPLMTLNEYVEAKPKSFVLNFVWIDINDIYNPNLDSVANDGKTVFLLTTDNEHGMAEQRRVFFEFYNRGIKNPVIIKRDYKNIDVDKFSLYSATDFGGLFIDGFGDGVWAHVDNLITNNGRTRLEIVTNILFGILQAARVRISKTEYIACPSCGRTRFDLVEVTEMIRSRTSHLKGVKIGIMGCIVNGPGEMADADYGYVGSGIGKITLYRGKQVVKRNIPSENAVDKLIELIREDGLWIEPEKG